LTLRREFLGQWPVSIGRRDCSECDRTGGAMTNPFRDNEILLPVGFDDDNDDPPLASTAA
jgi:hypothetical protein